MNDALPFEIRPHPLARWLFGCTLLPVSAFLLFSVISYYNRSDYSGCVADFIGSGLLAFLTINLLTTKILLSDDSIEIRSLVFPKRKMLRKSIRSKTPYTGGKGAHGLLLNSSDPAVRRMRVDLTMLGPTDEKRVRDFLRDIPVERRKKKKWF